MNDRNRFNIIAIALVAALLFSFLTIFASAEAGRADSRRLSVSARSAVLYVPESGEALFTKNADARMPMASTTKIMTALVAIENSELSERVEIDGRAVGTEGSSAYLRDGDVLTMEELLYALMLQSANDAAVAIACHVAGGIEEFAGIMNERAEKIGLTDTHFTNPHGLDDEEHYTTARELARIAAVAMESPIFRKICATYKKTFKTEERERTYVNHNKLLTRYDDAVGIKTGFTKKSGRCLVAAAERDGLTLISVTLDAPSDWSDHERMLECGFDTVEKIELANTGDISYDVPVIGGTVDKVLVANEETAAVVRTRGEYEIKSYVRLEPFVIAPIKRGTVLGSVVFTLDGEEVARIALKAQDSVEKKKEPSFFERIFGKNR